MSLYISGPDGQLLLFDSEAEVEAYRKAQPEPPLLQRLRKYHTDMRGLSNEATSALTQRKGRNDALSYIGSRLRWIRDEMSIDIQAAEKASAIAPNAVTAE